MSDTTHQRVIPLAAVVTGARVLRFHLTLGDLTLHPMHTPPHQEITMPKVGGKHFKYSAEGKKAAKAYAKKTGKKVTRKKAPSKKKNKRGSY